MTDTNTISLKDILVCLDNGHGKETPGKQSPDGRLKEWAYTRELVGILKDKLEDKGMSVYTVVPETEDIRLSERTRRANSAAKGYRHSLFISMHVNAAGNGSSWTSAHGWSCYTTKGMTNSDILADHLYTAAEKYVSDSFSMRRYSNAEYGKDYEENFTVIYKADMPAVLIENMFMDNRQDVEFLLSDRGKDILTDICAEGISSFVVSQYEFIH